MKISKTLAILAAGAALLSTAPALAGPAGEGRTFTVEMMHKQLAARTVKVAASGDQACLSQAAASLKARDDVHSASAKPGQVHVTFRTADHAAQGEAHVRDAVAKACA
jgi:hypothetical protein